MCNRKLGWHCCLLILVSLLAELAEGGRYRHCSRGCCPHEFCAFHKICYPKMHCHYGCPDGTCVKGICMPYSPCSTSKDCRKIAQSCSTNYNLGYQTCQYNLDIGKTLCVDMYGHSLIEGEP